MRDVRTKIVRDLELFVDDDYGIELLVTNRIINLNLPIKLVYEQVWRKRTENRGGEDTPMVVVYRLQGLDGEATGFFSPHFFDMIFISLVGFFFCRGDG